MNISFFFLKIFRFVILDKHVWLDMYHDKEKIVYVDQEGDKTIETKIFVKTSLTWNTPSWYIRPGV